MATGHHIELWRYRKSVSPSSQKILLAMLAQTVAGFFFFFNKVVKEGLTEEVTSERRQG